MNNRLFKVYLCRGFATAFCLLWGLQDDASGIDWLAREHAGQR